MRLILGSGSPRRREILTKMGYSFEVITADVEESDDERLGLEGLSIYNAKLKADTVFQRLSKTNCAVIGSDTVVWLEGKAYGKPTCVEDAQRMLSELSGKTHQVGTGIAIVTETHTDVFCEIAEVTFKELSPEVIKAYIEDVPVMDKAGSYAIQDGGERVIQEYSGEFECVMGLPVLKLTTKLKELGVPSI